jgi:hypothetical protein
MPAQDCSASPGGGRGRPVAGLCRGIRARARWHRFRSANHFGLRVGRRDHPGTDIKRSSDLARARITERGWVPTPQVFGNEEFSELSRATEWLRNHLSGQSDFSTSIRADAKEHDISPRTLRRAFRRLNGFLSKDKETGKWLWHLPTHFQSAIPSTTETEETEVADERSEVKENPGLPEWEAHPLSANQNNSDELSNVGQTWPNTNSALNTMEQACWPKVANVVQT